MDEKKVREAIAWMENERKIHKYGAYVSPSIQKERIDMIEEYYNLAIEALEKQLPKKPKEDDEQNVRYVTVYVCPYCGKRFTGAASTYCYHCGQALDWGV